MRLGEPKAQGKILDPWVTSINDAKNALIISDVIDDVEFRHIYELYDAAVRACHAVDFDDSQDSNEAQHRILCSLCGKVYFKVMLVGDLKQAIFT